MSGMQLSSLRSWGNLGRMEVQSWVLSCTLSHFLLPWHGTLALVHPHQYSRTHACVCVCVCVCVCAHTHTHILYFCLNVYNIYNYSTMTWPITCMSAQAYYPLMFDHMINTNAETAP